MQIKRILKNIIEDIFRFFSEDNLFRIRFGSKKFVFYLPNRRDWLQQNLIVRRRFYEDSFLAKLPKYLPREPFILEIGANIGNHSIFYAGILNAKKIYAFEPQKEVFFILKRNIELNGFKKKIFPFNYALGKKESKAEVFKKVLNNLGATSFKVSKEGKVKVKTIDSLNLNKKVDFIKIDTEGFEKDILLGARKTIKKFRPVVFVEVDDKNKPFVIDYFMKLGYSRVFFDKDNWLFIRVISEK